MDDSDTTPEDDEPHGDDTGGDGNRETRLRDVRRAAVVAVSTVVGLCVDWVERRSRLSQLLLGGLIAVSSEATVPVLQRLGALALANLSSVTATSWLSMLVGTQIGQTVVQMQKLDKIGEEMEAMEADTGTTETDGGRPARSWRTGGGIIGGAIAGAGFGSSFGTRGLFVGLAVGIVLGDTFEEWLLSS
ncbi:hypothetical protein [Halobaculum sp. MBLA0143]|uniref:hypothetical protein n=1 Tax=Halobaculum sp. MBLA0143 TaxID=3079933 RepID=UPI003524E2B9